MNSRASGRDARKGAWACGIDGSGVAYFSVSALILLGIVCLIVGEHPPPEIPRSEAERNERALERHNYGVYFKAITVAKTFVPGIPDIKWSHIGLNRNSSSCVLRHGLWYVQGEADVPTGPGVLSPTPWQLIFEPEAERAVYFRIGDLQFGDAHAAVQAMNGP